MFMIAEAAADQLSNLNGAHAVLQKSWLCLQGGRPWQQMKLTGVSLSPNVAGKLNDQAGMQADDQGHASSAAASLHFYQTLPAKLKSFLTSKT
jgi:hypothetical protein